MRIKRADPTTKEVHMPNEKVRNLQHWPSIDIKTFNMWNLGFHQPGVDTTSWPTLSPFKGTETAGVQFYTYVHPYKPRHLFVHLLTPSAALSLNWNCLLVMISPCHLIWLPRRTPVFCFSWTDTSSGDTVSPSTHIYILMIAAPLTYQQLQTMGHKIYSLYLRVY